MNLNTFLLKRISLVSSLVSVCLYVVLINNGSVDSHGLANSSLKSLCLHKGSAVLLAITQLCVGVESKF